MSMGVCTFYVIELHFVTIRTLRPKGYKESLNTLMLAYDCRPHFWL